MPRPTFKEFVAEREKDHRQTGSTSAKQALRPRQSGLTEPGYSGLAHSGLAQSGPSRHFSLNVNSIIARQFPSWLSPLSLADRNGTLRRHAVPQHVPFMSIAEPRKLPPSPILKPPGLPAS
jgi:hypothetical protein